jgi:hypothetical protein
MLGMPLIWNLWLNKWFWSLTTTIISNPISTSITISFLLDLWIFRFSPLRITLWWLWSKFLFIHLYNEIILWLWWFITQSSIVENPCTWFAAHLLLVWDILIVYFTISGCNIRKILNFLSLLCFTCIAYEILNLWFAYTKTTLEYLNACE